VVQPGDLYTNDLLFVNRATELDEFNALLTDLNGGHQRHLALLGLRRIGKTVLLDEVRRRHPTFAIAYLALDEAVSTPEDFARAYLHEVLRAVTTTKNMAAPEGQSDKQLRQVAQQLEQTAVAALEAALAPLATGRIRTSYAALFVATMRFPSMVAMSASIPLVVMFDEFQEITRLLAFPGSDNLMGTLRAALDR
jgi:AAA+ ATPase superfamily predicted ATPase